LIGIGHNRGVKMGGVIQEQVLRATVEYEHKKKGKVRSKGYSYGDWIGFTHIVQDQPGRIDENIFDAAGNLIQTKIYRGIGCVMAKITQAIMKRR